MKHIKIFEEFYSIEKFISKTNRGELYEKDGNIIKYTTDKIEFENALKLVNKHNRHFVKYYSSTQISDGYYRLEMERLEELSDNQYEMIELIQNSLGIQSYMLNDNKRYSFIKELKNNPEYYEDFATFKEIYSMVLLLKRIYIEASYLDIKLYDLRADNMGISNGNIVHFDLGSG